MSMRLFTAFGEVAFRGMDTVARGLRQFEAVGRQVQESLDRIGSSAEYAGRTLSGSITAPILAAATAASALSLRTIGLVRDLRNTARALNLTASELQRLRLGLRGVLDEAQVDGLFGNLNRGINEFVATGAGQFADFFENIGRRYGITAERMARATPTEQLETMFRAVMRSSRSFEHFRAQLQALGPEYAAMAQEYWDHGNEMFDRVEARAAEHPAAVSENLIQLSEEWDRRWGQMAGVATGWSNRISETTIPVMITLLDLFEQRGIPVIEKLIGYVEQMSEWFLSMDSETQAWTISVVGLVAVVGPLLVILGGLISVIGIAVGALVKIGSGFLRLGGVFVAAAGYLRPLVVAIASGMGTIAGLVARAVLTVTSLVLSVGSVFARAIPFVVSFIARFTPIGAAFAAGYAAGLLLVEAVRRLIDIGLQVGPAIIGAGQSVLSFFSKMASEIGSLVSGWASSAMVGATQMARSIWNAVSGLPSQFLALGARVGQAMIDGLSILPSVVMGIISHMAESVTARVRQLASDIGSTLQRLYDRVVGNSIIPDMASEVVDEIGSMADGSIRETRRMRSGMIQQMPERPDFRPPASSASGGQPAGGSVVFDLRHAIFRDDRDMVNRARLSGALPTGVFG